METQKYYSTDKLLRMITSFIEVHDSELVNYRKCFPCKREDHTTCKRIRDLFLEIYENANFSNSVLFQNKIQGKSKSVIDYLIKESLKPINRREFKEHILESLALIRSSNKIFELTSLTEKQVLIEIQAEISKL